MGKSRKLISHENQIKGNANAVRGEAKERKKENWSKNDQKGEMMMEQNYIRGA